MTKQRVTDCVEREVGHWSPSRRVAGLICRALVAVLALGCSTADKTLTYLGDSDMKEYQGFETTLEQPPDGERSMEPTAGSLRPHTINDREHDQIWDMGLVEAIHLALVNNRIARTRNDFLSPGNAVLNNADGVQSTYDPAIRDSGVLFGTRGVESALAAFDTQWTNSMVWGQSSVIQNNTFLAGGLPEGGVLNQDTGAFQTALQKNMAYGATVSISNTWNYLQSNPIFQLFPSVYTGNVAVNYTQPLWAGSGTEVNRIAGPIALNVPGVSGVNQGVMVARINTDMSLLDFEAAVRNMIKDVEDVYWELYLAYRRWDSLVTAKNNALATWRVVNAKAKNGTTGGGAAEEAQALEAYYDARAQVEAALGGPNGLYATELQLRRLLRLPANDGRVIRAVDEPVVADFVPNWNVCLAEALTRREEIRKQKWNIKSNELQLQAARNLAHPQFNFVSSYQLNGFGNNLWGANRDGTTRRDELQSAMKTLFDAQQTGWTLGFQFNMPLGLRNAKSQVTNYELRVAKARDVLCSQEIEVSHELANAFQMLDYWYSAMATGYNRYLAADRRLQGVIAEYQADKKELEFLLQAQTRLAQAEAAYFGSVVEYNKAVTNIHYRKGTLLENNNIHLSEASWTPDAYRDALRRAWARTFAMDPIFSDAVRQEPASFTTGIPLDGLHMPGWAPSEENAGQEPEPMAPVAPSPEDVKPGLVQPLSLNSTSKGRVPEGFVMEQSGSAPFPSAGSPRANGDLDGIESQDN